MKRFGGKRGILRELTNSHHVDHGHGLTEVSWVNHVKVDYVIVFDMVGEEVVDGVLIRRSCTLQPEGVRPRWVLHRGFIVIQAKANGRQWSMPHRAPFWSSRDHQIRIYPPCMVWPSRSLSPCGMVTLERRKIVARSRSIYDRIYEELAFC